MRAQTTPPSTPTFLPTTRAEIEARGWDEVDIVFVSGDAYLDHPSFAAALLGRVLESKGYRVAILAQPDWKSADPWRELGRPRLFYAVSAGNMDSMINHYTANRKRRNKDSYSPGGSIECRPDRATNVYAQRCREAFKGVPVIIGGVEASLRRIAHYDYWSDMVRPSILISSKADLLGFGMGERVIVELADRLRDGQSLSDLRDMRGVAYLLGKNGEVPESEHETRALPSFEEVKSDHHAFAVMTRDLHHETNPFNGRRLTQSHGDRTLVINPADLPLDEPEMDAIYDLPYTRSAHFSYTEPIPAHEMIKDSITIMRGCFGGCTFCSITMHQGRTIQSRSEESILKEVKDLADDPKFKGHISDLGGPTANMYRMRCTKPEVEKICRRLSCIHPTICKLLGTDHEPTIDLMRKSREIPGIKKVNIQSGVRTDLAVLSPKYLEELTAHHVGGHLKVAPEHTSTKVLDLMKKPAIDGFDQFAQEFTKASEKAGKEQYLVPYFIASHPGSNTEDMIELAEFLNARGYRPLQVQDFIPAPMDIATCMYYTGLDPITMAPVETAKKLKDRVVQRSLMQFFAPENYFTVKEALLAAGRSDLIGTSKKCLIGPNPPREAQQANRERRGSKGKGDEGRVHSPKKGKKQR
jgi:uncharacterized radical SAM protein YgiQ